MKIAVAQMSCALGDVPANLARMRDFCRRASDAGAEMILFPEMSDTGYAMSVIREHATSWEDGAVAELQKIAREFGIAIVAGVSERADEEIFNAQVALDAHGKVVASYRKTHLFTPAPIEEHTCFSAGNALRSFACGELQFGLSICYDLRFPEVSRTLSVTESATAFLISSAWPFPRAEHLRTLALARAIENQSYVALANRVGTDAGTMFCGGSAVIDPSGAIIAAASSDREEILCAEISREVIKAVRARMPVFDARRPELYFGASDATS